MRWTNSFVLKLKSLFEDDEICYFIDIFRLEIIKNSSFVESRSLEIDFVKLTAALLVSSTKSKTAFFHSLYLAFVEGLKLVCDSYQTFLINQHHLEVLMESEMESD